MKHKIIFKALVGSHSHGTNTKDSDEDYSGVYIQNNDDILSYGYEEYVQVNKDEKYFEVKRFLDLLMVSNPAVLELLFAPEDCVLEIDPRFKMIYDNRHKFLTKKCYNTFAGYAKTQISKSKGTNKKINWEAQRVTRKTPLDFCFVHFHGKTLPLTVFLENSGMKQEKCGLVKLNHFDNGYALYYDHFDNQKFKGIIGENSNELRLTSIDKDFADKYGEPVVLFYNKDGFTTHCADYKSYQTWLNERNLNRFHTNVSHGQIYDSKNISHCFRLVSVAKEIALFNDLFVRRTNDVNYLLQIKRGEVPLDKIIEDVEKEISGLKELYDNSNLPEEVDPLFVKELLLNIRKYKEPIKTIGVVCDNIDHFLEFKKSLNVIDEKYTKYYFILHDEKYKYISRNSVLSFIHGQNYNNVIFFSELTEEEKNSEWYSILRSQICTKNTK